MPIQTFKIYTGKGYAGDLVDSGPRTIQSGVLTTSSAGFGLGMQRDTSVERGCKLGGVAGALYAISQREYNHEAATRPSRSEERTSELQSPDHLVCRLLLEKNT